MNDDQKSTIVRLDELKRRRRQRSFECERIERRPVEQIPLDVDKYAGPRAYIPMTRESARADAVDVWRRIILFLVIVGAIAILGFVSAALTYGFSILLRVYA